MKNLFYLALLVLTLILIYVASSQVLNQSGRYLIYTEPVPTGSNECTVILLDSNSGKSWSLIDQGWRPLNQTTEEKMVNQQEVMAIEINKLKEAQGREIGLIKARYEQEYNALLQKMNQVSSPLKRVTYRARPKKEAKPAEPEPEVESDSSENSPPGWLTR